MTDREKVIKGLEMCIMHYCDECPFDDEKGCFDKLMDRAIALLKEQEAVPPIPYHRSDGTIFKYECRKCRTKIFKGDLFCRHCGNPVLWEGR